MSKTFKQIKQPNKLSKEIEKQIEDSIRNKILLPGDELPSENELCDIFGVSRTALREAIHMLGTRGLVTSKRGKKTVINEYHEVLNISPIQFYLECNLSDKLIQDWINIRVSLEPTLARLAALNRTDDDLKILKKIINNLELKKNINNGKLLATLDKNFHSCIAAATQNPIIPLIMKPIYDMMPTIKSIIINRSPASAKHTNEEHQKIYKCIANKDEDGAFLSMVEHMDSATKHVYETHIS
jgi:GntR family transcriptional repressor for pyruvate dehydrogenase complex